MPELLEELRRVMHSQDGSTRTVDFQLLAAIADGFARAVDERDTALMRLKHLEDQQKGWVAYVNKTLEELRKAGLR